MDQEKYLIAAQSLQALFDSTSGDLGIVQNVAELNSRFDRIEDVLDVEELDTNDPAVIAIEVASQISYLKKLKFQCIEQNAKEKYTRAVVSDIDHAPVVSESDNKQLEQENLAELQTDFKTLSPMVEEDYIHVKQATAKATELAQKIIDARLALSRLRQMHPLPRVTVQTANQKLEDQVVEMQTLTDKLEDVQQKAHDAKGKLKAESLEVETLKLQRNERLDDDRRFVPLYDWLSGSLILHRSMHGLDDIQPVSDNELRLHYRVENLHGHSRPVAITLLFLPNTRQLVTVDVQGLEDLGMDLSDIIDSHLRMNDVPGVVVAILGQARDGLAA
ncbi:hypothetical protein BT96DRAFT_957222 [Gymnopus androsaceus JB14]|uniref:Kinetochore protein Sos7 coiled-coil domain-containing protein n=1 Tax=Gymnopus androsaceus JB14 TaxID=1447944 RepID=A0A6A4HRF8_9AGAR|nr:hypothetical protein BT96DRAFT_957222 [Gymnopus androsaceus JB14]